MSLEVARARDYMTSGVISVDVETPLTEVLRTLEQRNISCVLVTSHGGDPAGVISMSDLVRVAKSHRDEDRMLATRERGGHGWRARLMPSGMHARDVMKPDLIAVEVVAPVSEAAATMLNHRVHRVFVTEGGKVVGIFSSRDAMRVVLSRKLETPLRDVMATPETLRLGDTIDDALAKLDDGNVRGLAILDGKTPIGLFTHLEAIRARALPATLRERSVEEMMSYATCYLDASTPLYRAAGQAIDTGIRRILVTEARALVGIVTGYDLTRVLIAS